MTLGLPARDLNVHLVHIVLVWKLLVIVLGRALGFSPPQNLLPLLPDVPPPILQPLAGLRLHDTLFHQGDDVPRGRVERRHRQDGKLEEEHDHHIGPSLLNHVVDGIAQEPDIVANAEKEGNAEPSMEESRVRGGLLLENLDPALANPSPDLARDQGGKHNEKPGANLFAEDGHGQACLGDGEPSLLIELLDLGGAKRAEAEALEAVHEDAVDDEYQVYQNL